MKKIFLIIAFITMGLSLFAQEKSDTIPADILENLSKIGLDDSPLLNQYESRFLNYFLPSVRYTGLSENVDFTSLRAAFFKGNVGTVEFGKKEFFADIDFFSPGDYSFQIILFSKENAAKLNYDVAIIHLSKRLNTEKEIVRLLKKNQQIQHHSCPDSSYYIVSHINKINAISGEILNHLDAMGTNDSLILNQYESALLNIVFKDSLYGFDFTNKKIGFINNGIKGKTEYFNMYKKSLADENFPFDVGTLYIFNEKQKKESGGYDAAIVYWCKFILPPDKVVERLK